MLQAGRGGLCLQSQHFGRSRWADHLRSGVGDQPGQHSETPSLLRIQKINWAWGSRGGWAGEVAASGESGTSCGGGSIEAAFMTFYSEVKQVEKRDLVLT